MTNKGVHLHRLDGSRGYSIENCALTHKDCHREFHRQHPHARFLSTTKLPIKTVRSKKYSNKTFAYWWDVPPDFLDFSYEFVEFIKKDTNESCMVSVSDIRCFLTSERQTSRDRGNWGVRILNQRPGELAFEPGRKSKGWLYHRVKWKSG